MACCEYSCKCGFWDMSNDLLLVCPMCSNPIHPMFDERPEVYTETEEQEDEQEEEDE